MEVLIILGVIALLILGGFGAYHARQRMLERQADLAALATDRGWIYSSDYDYSHDSRYPDFSVFQQGHSRYAYNTLRGSIDIDGQPWPILLGDYHYKITSRNGKKTTTRTYTLSFGIIELPYAQLPDLTIRAEGSVRQDRRFLRFRRHRFRVGRV